MEPWNKSLNFIFPTKYVIPKSLKFSPWPSKYVYCPAQRKINYVCSMFNVQMERGPNNPTRGQIHSHWTKCPTNHAFLGDSNRRDLFIIRLEVTGGHLSIPKNRAPAELPGWPIFATMDCLGIRPPSRSPQNPQRRGFVGFFVNLRGRWRNDLSRRKGFPWGEKS